ncbi:hypothetical protein PGTUg99_006785 [Puccinia graminis f. sp. tritici]|uniref:Uncharacterized protein n=1 Tax=Puccinia graminis f. sp. tritici TaxID=56615 RepID=A0A5B0QYM0_PUCGR|nr:hypothetical protein PGTUg99_006785 [Puccinia graminis f. sp. tritici]
MDESIRPEAAQAVDLLNRHDRACEDKGYRRVLKKQNEKWRYVNTESKVLSLREMVSRELGLNVSVSHPRLWYLRITDSSAPMKNLGTPPVPRPDSQGQLPDDEDAVLLRQLMYELDLLSRPT